MLPEAFVDNVTDGWGDAGRRWLADLPDLVDAIARDWGLTVGDPYDLTFHYVAPAVDRDGTATVLKLGVPSGDSLRTEVPALTAFAGRGAVRLLRTDLDRGALLLERADPGWRARDLVPHRDTDATSAAITVMRRLYVPALPDTGLPELVGQAGAFDEYLDRCGTAGPLPADLVARAGALMRELCATATARVVLHGDLHHDNILRATREPWLAIDPHGIVGDPGYELGALLYNPLGQDVLTLVPSRIDQLAQELALPVERVVAWGFVKAMLSEVWSAEDRPAGASPSPTGRAFERRPCPIRTVIAVRSVRAGCRPDRRPTAPRCRTRAGRSPPRGSLRPRSARLPPHPVPPSRRR